MSDVADYLRSKGIPLKAAGARNIHTACFFCAEDPGARGRLYINIDDGVEVPGLYFCHRCQAKGNLTTLKRHFGDVVAESDVDHQVRSEIFNVAAAYYQARLDQFPEVLRYLTGPQRGLTVDTVDAAQLGYAPMEFDHDATRDTIVRRPRRLYSHLRDAGYSPKDILATGLCQEHHDTIVDSLFGAVTIPYLVAGNVVTIRGRTWPANDDDWAQWRGVRYEPSPAKYKTLAGARSRLFNTDATWEADEVILTEGEFDALVLAQRGYATVGSPGANAWQDAWDGYLEKAKRIWLLLDRDAAGEAAAVKLAERFGPRARRLQLSDAGTKCDPTQWFADGHSTEEFDALLAAARKGGLLVTVREAIAEYLDVQHLPGIKFAWDDLDIAIEPGLQPSQLMLLLAKTGTGKTLALLNFMHRVRMHAGQDHLKILFVSLEQTRGEWWDRARRIYRFYNLTSTEEEAARWWEQSLLIVDRNRLSEDDFRQILDDYGAHMGGLPDLVCLDYLGYWARSFRGEAYERTSNAVMALKGIAKEFRIPMIVPHQVSRIGRDGEEFEASAARDSGVIEETADFLLTMWSPDNALGRDDAERTGQIHMRIAKSRHGGRGTLLEMQMAPLTLALVPKYDPHAARAAREFDWRRNYKDNWETAIYRHITGFEGRFKDDAS